jgi:hypothetical protein
MRLVYFILEKKARIKIIYINVLIPLFKKCFYV